MYFVVVSHFLTPIFYLIVQVSQTLLSLIIRKVKILNLQHQSQYNPQQCDLL